ncbi:cyclic-di-AMP receptor [Anaerolentibacter hominis]|uniref:cyclic-di-AMP receptor n=1 Tax=Anaerolentibacter hominis TaxID=3079009 RepID=UPI0031B806CA
MKLIYAIINDDANDVISELNQNGFSVTKLATTGGFLRKGNTTLLIGTDEEKVQDVIDIVKKNCAQREQLVYNTPIPPAGGLGVGCYMPTPVNIEVGGAIVFVTDVDRFEKV